MAKRTTYNVTEERKMKLERLAINASVKLGKTITWTEILGYLIDNYSKDAAEDLMSSKQKD
ncbi:TPA: hypothetical protein ME382_005308 [Klebsiella pneumoniae]|jgi:hypothetical protein|uniref:hypothetical protein n=1 Tax=Enterobacteriaceae TaxID=543 RepID=UPI00130A1479|nr:hypothetical protein [Klebsiella sp. DNRA6]EBW2026022.1 hypothetical protein [Salmonella enterica subsp. enterica serovar Infantis]EDM1757563.1 hypothetical protein [Salmonella enterica subsp. diarizonae]EHF7507537.1 hypothetical protein [Salmonella enterica]HBW4188467.1 hypothetical protein [Klebsiella pneumoniae]NMD78059.1 hypothetical protein [Klebsiella sp. DNRA6]